MPYPCYISKFLLRLVDRSSLHGAFHLQSSRTTALEKFFWMLIIILAMAVSNYLMTLFWLRYLTNPTVIALDRNYHEWNTTFPSLTVCFHNRLNVTARDALIESVQPANVTKFKKFLNLLAETDISNFEPLLAFDEYSDMDLRAVLNQIVNTVDTNVIINDKMEISLQRVITNLGVCYTFNSEIVKHFSADTGEKMNPGDPLFEISIMERETTAALQNLTSNGNIFYHGPFEVPTYLKRLIVSTSTNALLMMTYKPVIIAADDSIQNLYIKQRNCRFIHESNLELFPNYYSHSLCMLECNLKYFREHCGCVPFLYDLEGERKCPLRRSPCIAQVLALIQQNILSCDCLKDCHSISFTLQNYLIVDWFNDPLIRWSMDIPKVRYSRKIIYGFADALVSTGGMAALFYGASFVTIVELLFLFVRNIIEPNNGSGVKKIKRVAR